MTILPSELRADLSKAALDGIVRWLRTLSDPADGTINSPYVDTIRDSANAVDLQVKVVNIGDWNMSAATGVATVNVAHGLTLANIRSCNVLIRNDADTIRSVWSGPDGTLTNLDGRIGDIDATNVELRRTTGGFYDGTTYNDTSYNRGFILIWHTP